MLCYYAQWCFTCIYWAQHIFPDKPDSNLIKQPGWPGKGGALFVTPPILKHTRPALLSARCGICGESLSAVGHLNKSVCFVLVTK